MANNTITISGMFGANKTYFADAPVIIYVNGLEWPKEPESPFTVVGIDVTYNNRTVGSYREDTGGQSSMRFNISSALKGIWATEDFTGEVAAAQAALTADSAQEMLRDMREYSLEVKTEYLSDGIFTPNSFGPFAGGRCIMGGLTEWERSRIGSEENADVSYWNHCNLRNGDASTKPSTAPERVGRDSITSWVDVNVAGTISIFYPKVAAGGTGDDDSTDSHAPLVLRDSQPYVDFLFVNRRGAVETCSAPMQEAMNIDVETKTYDCIDGVSFIPSRSQTTITQGGPRRSWPMSSGKQTREWVEWWTKEFLTARRVWMLYKGIYVPVTVEPAKKSTNIYDRSKQQLASVEFTVTLGLEG